jgi:hypothetical protein
MDRCDTFLAVTFAVLLGCDIASAQIDVQKSVLTQRNDNWRRGAYLTETELTRSNVAKATFGHLSRLSVTGPILAQPLFVKGVNVGAKSTDVVYVATRMNTIHAFDVGGDLPPNGAPTLWTLELPLVPTVPSKQPVTAVWRDQNHLDLFLTASDGRVFSNFWDRDNGWWHEWFPIRPDSAVAAAGVAQEITAVWGDPNDPLHLNLFMVDKDGTVKSIFCSIQPNKPPCWKDEAWFPIGSRGVASPGQPVTAVWRDRFHLDVFIVGTDGQVLSNFWQQGSGWHDWFAIRPDTALAAAGRPQQVTALWGDPNHPQHLNLFIVDREGTVKSIYCTLLPSQPCWQREAWFPIGPSSLAVPGQPVTALWRDRSFAHMIYS